MGKEKFSNIQSKMPKAIAETSENANATEMYFCRKYNPFLPDYVNSKRYLKKCIERDIKLTNIFKDRDCSAIKDLCKTTQLRLDFCLYCMYAMELQTGENLFSCCPPITDKFAQFVYQHRLDNFVKYKKMFEHFSKNISENISNVYPEKTVKNLVRDNFGNADIADARFLLSEKMQNELAYKIYKTPVTKDYIHMQKNGYDYYQRFYLAKYHENVVMFSEVVRAGKNKTNKQELSYQLNLVLNGNIDKNRILYRMDYGTGAKHINKFEKTAQLNTTNGPVDLDVLRHTSVKSCHIHVPNNKYAVVFPNYIHSSDAKEYNFKFDGLEQFLNFNHNLIKAKAQALFTEEEKADLKENIKTQKVKILDVFSKFSQDDLEQNYKK